MNVVLLEDLSQQCIFENRMFLKLDFQNSEVMRLVESIGRCGKDEQLLEVLHSINSPIESIDTIAWRYYCHSEPFGLIRLCRGEKIFAAAYAATVGLSHTYFRWDVKQLTKTNLRKFVKTFLDSPYVNIVADNKVEEIFYNSILKEVKYG